jgi:hypothetical protein
MMSSSSWFNYGQSFTGQASQYLQPGSWNNVMSNFNPSQQQTGWNVQSNLFGFKEYGNLYALSSRTESKCSASGCAGRATQQSEPSGYNREQYPQINYPTQPITIGPIVEGRPPREVIPQPGQFYPL